MCPGTFLLLQPFLAPIPSPCSDWSVLYLPFSLGRRLLKLQLEGNMEIRSNSSKLQEIPDS